MNKSYRLVFNRAKGVVQVVAEFVKSNSKMPGSKTVTVTGELGASTAPALKRKVLALALMSIVAVVSTNSYAAGSDGNSTNGAGGNGDTSSFGGGAGGAGGSNTVDWLNLSQNQDIGGGGGGGAGSVSSTGVAGSDGGAGGAGGYIAGGTVGQAGTTAGGPGSPGGNISVTSTPGNDFAGAGGGGGGAAGTIFTTTIVGTTQTYTGGAGGAGGSTITNPNTAYGGGGGGGGGGAGVVLYEFAGGLSATIAYDVTGGRGGDGGAGNTYDPSTGVSGYTNASGGGGGGGGAGIFAQGFSVTNNYGKVIQGGDGGAGGYGNGDGGSGGAGGAGLVMVPMTGNETLTNYGSIIGGAGGTGGDTGGGAYYLTNTQVPHRSFQAGAGGAGGNALTVSGNNSAYISNQSSGVLQGGDGGAGGNSVSYTPYAANGGAGGAGGHGVFIDAPSAHLDNFGSITGGNGGDGGLGTRFNSYYVGVNGGGGAGGDGIQFAAGANGINVVNHYGATIAGGAGGNAGSNFDNPGAAGGAGGVGIRLKEGLSYIYNNAGSSYGGIFGGNGGTGGDGLTAGSGGAGGAGISASQLGSAQIFNGDQYGSVGTIRGGIGGTGGRASAPATASATGANGGAGIEFLVGRNQLTNYFNATVQGGVGGAGGAGYNGGYGGAGGAGGAGVRVNSDNTTRITNGGEILGGDGGISATDAVLPGGAGGAGINATTTTAGVDTRVRNSGGYNYSTSGVYSALIRGGVGGAGANSTTGVGLTGGVGGAGILGNYLEITNGDGQYYYSQIVGGVGGEGGIGATNGGQGGSGGAGIALVRPGNGEISTVVNNALASIVGGTGGMGGHGNAGNGGAGGAGGAGILIGINGNPAYGSIDNSGQILGGVGGAGGAGSIGNGNGGAGGAGIAIVIGSTATSIQNNVYSYITGGNGGNGAVGGAGGAGILNEGTITSLMNSGTILGGSGVNGAADAAGIVNRGNITTLTNMGVISGSVGIDNTSGSIATLINAQGGDGLSAATTALTFKGTLVGSGSQPYLNYRTYVTSQSSYGQLYMQSVSGLMNFGIATGSPFTDITGSNVVTYSNVLSGIGSGLINNYSSIHTQWTTFSNYQWKLVDGSNCSLTCWDLAVTALPTPTNINAGQTYYTADLVGGSGTSNVNPVFDGGTLAVSPSTPGATVAVADNFTLSNNGGTIDQNAQIAVFSGMVSDAVNGTPGSLIITNSVAGNQGRIELTGNNTYTGSTTIDAGAELWLSNAGSIASSSGVVDNGVFDVSSVTTAGGASIQSLSGTGVLALGSKTLTLSNAAGTFSGSITGTNAKIVIASGTETLTGANNNFTGGIEVQAGAALSINSARNLGANANTLDLIGTSNTTATLNVLGTTTINNLISVTGDPTFNIASGTTTTIASSVADGSAPGDVVVAGGGTLNLTAANTYTGQTTVTNGATLALGGSGSIATSSLVTNNGTFNVSNAMGNVTLNSFTQGTGGNLVMGFSPTNNQRINVLGAASLAGTLAINPTAGSYVAGRYTLLSAAGGITGNFSTFNAGSLRTYTRLLYALGYDATDVYLTLYGNAGPSAQNTLQSVQMNTGGLANVINQQAAGLQAGLQYDCVKYDENNLCISVGGRYTYAGSGPSGNAESGLVILGYQPSETWRFGGFVDQSVSTTTPSNIKVGYNGPMWGLFNNWYMNKDRLGLNVQGSLAFANSKVTTTRSQLTDTEPGQGTTQMNGQGYQLQANYVQPVTDNINAIPYFGLRYSRINNGAYTENATAQVTSPLSYNAMAQNTFAALAGVGASAHLAEKVKGTASVGLQQNLNYSMGNYAGTSQISGLETFSAQMPGSRNTMATASAGIYYDVRKNERIGMNVLWQQQPFINTNTATAIVTYTLGL